MKSITKILLSVCFISVTLSSVINRVKREKGFLFKDTEGSGSWETYYECPRILIAEGSGNYANQGTAKIYARNIVSPSTDADKLGLVLDFNTTPGEILRRVGTQVSGNKWYVPFRYFNGDFKYSNPNQENKNIEGWFSDDLKKSYRMKIDLPFKAGGWFITDEEAQKIMNAINGYATKEKGVIKSTKNEINTESSVYFQKKPLLDAAVKNKDSLATELKKQEDELNTLKTKIDGLKTQIESQKSNINNLKVSLADKEATLSSSEDQLLNDSKKYNSIADTLESNKKNTQPIEKTIQDLKTATQASADKLTTQFNTLRASAPIRRPEVDKSESAYKVLNNNDLLSNLNKIYP